MFLKEKRLLSHLHEVLLHVVGHEFHNFLLAVQLLRQRAGREGEVFVVGQAVVDSAVGRKIQTLITHTREYDAAPSGHRQSQPNKTFCT